MEWFYGAKKEYDFPIYKVSLCVSAVIILLCKSWDIKDWIYSEGLWANITHLNSSNISTGLSGLGNLVHEKVTTATVTILPQPQCYLNETPIIKANLLWPNNASELLKNLSNSNSTLTDIFNETLNVTKNQTGISSLFNLTDFTESMRLWYENFSFQKMVRAQVPSFDGESYFNFRTVTTTISEYAISIFVRVRTNICDVFALENC